MTNKTKITFDNRFIRDLPGDLSGVNAPRQVLHACWSKVKPTPVKNPKLIAYSEEAAKQLGIEQTWMQSPEMAQVLSGNQLQAGMDPYATCYGGHQFGEWAGQLGDGRAIFLGEIVNANKEHWEIQLKGSGPTPYSRFADGRAVLRSSIREFLCSEAMHFLGVPTTRALSLVDTGEVVMRDMFYDGNPASERGAIVCRVAPTFLRFGHFELLAKRNDKALLKNLIGYTIKNHFPELYSDGQYKLFNWLKEVVRRTAHLVAEWMRVGFVHGVMNTDNMSILGLTIDYGPYGWMENFDPSWTPNMSDYYRRYCYLYQPAIARWNCQKLAEVLLSPEETHKILSFFDYFYHEQIANVYANKLGFFTWNENDPLLVNALFELLQQAEVDMTIFFRKLSELDEKNPQIELFDAAFYRDDLREVYKVRFGNWLKQYIERLALEHSSKEERVKCMNAANPCYILRNYLAQEAIELAQQRDYQRINELLSLLKNPYDYQPGKDHFMGKRPHWANEKPGCSMLSCSS